MTILEHCHRAECTQVVDALQRRIAELESALDVALEAWEKMVSSDSDAIDEADALGVPFPPEMLTEYHRAIEAIAKLKEVRRD